MNIGIQQDVKFLKKYHGEKPQVDHQLKVCVFFSGIVKVVFAALHELKGKNLKGIAMELPSDCHGCPAYFLIIRFRKIWGMVIHHKIIPVHGKINPYYSPTTLW